jgi:hypothetical protein
VSSKYFIMAAVLVVPAHVSAQIGPPAPVPSQPQAQAQPQPQQKRAEEVAASPQDKEGADGYRLYSGRGGEYVQDCRHSHGTTGTLAGAGAGGLIAGAATSSPFMAAWGAVAGGLFGRHLDRNHDAAQNARNGCRAS